MSGRPVGLIERPHRIAVAALAVFVAAAVALTAAPLAGAATDVVAVESTTPVPGTGTIASDGSGGYSVQVPYFRIGAVHHYEFVDSTGKVVDEADVTVPAAEGEVVTVTTKNGGTLTLKTDHVDGVIQESGADSPSSGKGSYKPKADKAEKAKHKKKKKNKNK
jgi:hypothetical protein